MAKKKTGREEPKIETFQRNLRVDLSEKELAERADRAAHLVAQRDSKEADRKAANTAAKAQLEEIEAELRRVSGEVRDKATHRAVDCERIYDYGLGTVREVRRDTNVVLHLRAMTADERQLELGIERPASPSAEGQKLGDAVAKDEPPLPTQKRTKKGNGRGKGRSAEARA